MTNTKLVLSNVSSDNILVHISHIFHMSRLNCVFAPSYTWDDFSSWQIQFGCSQIQHVILCGRWKVQFNCYRLVTKWRQFKRECETNALAEIMIELLVDLSFMQAASDCWKQPNTLWVEREKDNRCGALNVWTRTTTAKSKRAHQKAKRAQYASEHSSLYY